MSILFERRVEPSLDASQAPPSINDGGAPGNVQRADDRRAEDRIDQLEQEVDHLRACIDQLLDIIDNQFDPSDDLALFVDRMSLFERRVQRVEDGVSDIQRASRRRTGDR